MKPMATPFWSIVALLCECPHYEEKGRWKVHLIMNERTEKNGVPVSILAPATLYSAWQLGEEKKNMNDSFHGNRVIDPLIQGCQTIYI